MPTDTVEINLDKVPLDPFAVPDSDPPEQDTADPDAPFGRFANGKPRKSPPKGSPVNDTPKRSRRAKSPAATGAPKDAAYYATKVQNLLDPLAALTSLASPLDGAIVAYQSPQIAAGWGKVAEIEPRVARLLDGGGSGMVWMEAILPTVMTGLMIMSAHEMLPPQIDQVVKKGVAQIAEQIGVEKLFRDAAPAA